MDHSLMSTPCSPSLRRVVLTEGPRRSHDVQRITSSVRRRDASIEHFRNSSTRSGHSSRTSGTTQGCLSRRNSTVLIFEDRTAQASTEVENTMARRTSTLLAKPARKAKVMTLETSHARETGDKVQEVGHGKLQMTAISLCRSTTKDARRRTMWMPSDDTTVVTIHPGMRTCTMKDDTIQLAEVMKVPQVKPRESAQVTTHPIISPIPSRRTPFEPLSVIGTNTTMADIASVSCGKENVPPGKSLRQQQEYVRKSESNRPTSLVHAQESREPQDTTFVPKGKFSTSTTSSQTKHVQRRREQMSKPSNVSQRLSSRPSLRTSVIVPDFPPSAKSLQRTVRKDTTSIRSSHNESIGAKALSSLTRYPVFSNDVARPQLFEDNWLAHQEVVLTQLINEIFCQIDDDSNGAMTLKPLRESLLHIHEEPSSVELHSRLIASLQCGALSSPKGAALANIDTDLGLRQQFLEIWTTSYNLHALKAAAEVIVGREIDGHTQDEELHAEDAINQSSLVKSIRRFLLVFFVRIDDLDIDKAGVHGSKELNSSYRWRKTVLRCLMLIQLLDKAKERRVITANLFQRSSQYKSSESLLKALAQMLMPSVGDVSRPLGYLSYTVRHVQLPLYEVTYKVNNLAVDFRDGILLTRLVETTLSRSSAEAETCKVSTDPNVCGQAQPASPGLHGCDRESRPLSKRLRLPCVSQAQKLHNVRIALSGLSGVCGLAQFSALNVKAADIVNGHRERSLSLLWALISDFGLRLLVNQDELRTEILRITECHHTEDVLVDQGMTEEDNLHNLLRLWAQSICTQRGIELSNLTTSFSNGKVLEAMIDAYSVCIPQASSMSRFVFGDKTVTVGTKLQNLGCSAAFVDLFASGATHIPSETTTISLLAFLASRLLPLSRTYRAAGTIQRAYRRRLNRVALSQRTVLARIARDCAIVVQTRQTVIQAAMVLQHAWRRVLAVRIQRLVGDVTRFQTILRAWTVRKALMGSLASVKENEFRTIGEFNMVRRTRWS